MSRVTRSPAKIAPRRVVVRKLVPIHEPLSLELSWRPVRASAPRPVAALWIPNGAITAFFERLEREPSVPWSSLRFHDVEGGVLLLDVLPRWMVFGVGVPLSGVDIDERCRVYFDRSLELPPVLRRVPPGIGSWMIVAMRGSIAIRQLPASSRGVLELFRADAREAHLAAAGETPPQDSRSTTPQLENDLRGSTAAVQVAEWMVGIERSEVDDVELKNELSRAFSPSKPSEPEPEPEARATRRGWLRHLIDRALPEAARKRRDGKGQEKVADLEKRSQIVRRQGRALSELLRKLSGPNWRDALRLGLPLREPGEKERGSRWLSPDPSLVARGADFSIDALEAKAAFGNVPVGSDLFRRFESLYRAAAERLVETHELRRAAHVFSYLLGDHERAGAILEEAGFSREAATVYYHLAERPRRAAVALMRAGLPAESARIWMDLGQWRRAAEGWERARDSAQAHAAWRKVAADLFDAGRLVESAEVRRDHLGERVAALHVLEKCARRLDRHWRVALRQAVDEWAKLGDANEAESLVASTLEAATAAIARRPQRSAFKNAMDLTEDITKLEFNALTETLARSRLTRRAWEQTVESWSAARESFAPLPRAELDSKLIAIASIVGRTLEDPWLASDVSTWIDSAHTEPRSLGIATESRSRSLTSTPTSLARSGENLVVGDDQGGIEIFDESLESVRRLDTRTSRPVTRVALAGADAYAAVDNEVHHFASETTSRTDAPLQIERSLKGSVQDLVPLPDRSALLRLSTAELHLIHPIHLRPLARVLEARARTFIAVACNRRYVAILSRRDPDEESASEDSTSSVRPPYEIDLLYRPDRTAPTTLREAERFAVDVDHASRIALPTPDGGELIIVGHEQLLVFPTRRDSVSCFELDISSVPNEVAPARIHALRRGRALMVAYADGSLETIALDSRKREYVAEPIGDGRERLAGFAMREGPAVAWQVSVSGEFRRVEIAT